MSPTASLRLPYADAETPREMYDDCRAVGSQLHFSETRSSLPHEQLTTEHLPTSWAVSEHAAALAGGLHLHLD